MLAGAQALAQAQDGEPACPPAQGLALQVLGSGGPIADDGRASSAYLVWLDGRARVMVDAGGGSFLRMGEAGARFEDLDIIALSHYHTDHSSGLPALLKSGYFSGRERPLAVSGPAAGGPFPGLSDFLSGLLDADIGAFGYLSGALDGSGMARIEPLEITGTSQAKPVLASERLQVTARQVPHGIVPTLGYRVELGGKALVLASDQNASDPTFADFAQGADLLVMHLAIPGSAARPARALHATPAEIGRLAERAGARKLVLSHFMARSLVNLEQNVAEVRQEFSGETQVAADLACFRP
jgi:ribonuclease BN (tRNA processing enzyme)